MPPLCVRRGVRARRRSLPAPKAYTHRHTHRRTQAMADIFVAAVAGAVATPVGMEERRGEGTALERINTYQWRAGKSSVRGFDLVLSCGSGMSGPHSV